MHLKLIYMHADIFTGRREKRIHRRESKRNLPPLLRRSVSLSHYQRIKVEEWGVWVLLLFFIEGSECWAACGQMLAISSSA
jgi:hypothetical protein